MFLAQKLTFFCGSRTLKSRSISNLIPVLDGFRWASPYFETQVCRNFFGPAGPQYDNPVFKDFNISDCALLALRTRSAVVETGRKPNFFSALLFFADHGASDPRDCIYALLGICDRSDAPFDTRALALIPDYDADVCTVYTRITRAQIESTGRFDILSYLPRPPWWPKINGLPSWVPDFQARTPYAPLFHFNPEAHFKSCGGRTLLDETQHVDDPSLRVEGIFLGTIADCEVSNLPRGKYPIIPRYSAQMALELDPAPPNSHER